MLIEENKSLKTIHTFHTAVYARYFSCIESIDALLSILSDHHYKSIQPLVLGGGSNVLFTCNFDGLVLQNKLPGIELVGEDSNHYYVKSGAGVNWHEFVRYCIGHDFSGIENLSLIPGTVGASPIQNIGAYGVEVKDAIDSVEFISLKDLSHHTLKASACNFGYRTSIFKQSLRNEVVITNVTFRLNKKPKFNINYGALEQELSINGVQTLSIRAISDAVIRIRERKLPNPALLGNAGSFFKNPEVPKSDFMLLKKQFPTIVAYEQENSIKLAAGWLIEQCGWKGARFGDAGVHKDQALVLVNYGNATGSELLNLSSSIIASVFEKFSIKLEREVNIF